MMSEAEVLPVAVETVVEPVKAKSKRAKASKPAAKVKAKPKAKSKAKKPAAKTVVKAKAKTKAKAKAEPAIHVMSVHIPVALLGKLDAAVAKNKKSQKPGASRSEYAVLQIAKALGVKSAR